MTDDELDARLMDKRRARCYWLMVKYNLTLEEWEAILASQGGKCAICKKIMKKKNTDHDHKTGKVRGILCTRCNNLLGYVRDNPSHLRAAADFLDLNSGKFVKSDDSVIQNDISVV